MYEEDDEQNGNQSGDQSSVGARIVNMFRPPQASGQDYGDYVNPNIALRVDPAMGMAYRFRPGLVGSAASGRDGQNGQSANGQTSTSVNPLGQYLPPIQTRDAQGKTLPKYRMGIGHRILATAANFANGFAGNGATPIYTGPGALNNRYYQDEALRQQQNDENGGSQKGTNQYRNAIDWRTIGQDPVSKKWYGKTFGGQKQEIETPPWATGQTDAADDAADNNDGEAEPPPRQRFQAVQKSKARR